MVQGVIDRSDTLLMTELHAIDADAEDTFGGFTGIGTNCRGSVCDGVIPGLAFPLSSVSPDDTYYPHVTRNGIPIVTGRSEEVAEGRIGVTNSYGGWLDHNAFFMTALNYYDGPVSDENYAGVIAGALSFGNDTGSRPVSGSASWSGAMTGVHSGTLQGVNGDAALQMDFDSAEIDVSFTDIRNATTGALHPRMSWSDLAVNSAGRFTAGDSLIGTFYGPDHEEVGGVFERGGIAGAFGARR